MKNTIHFYPAVFHKEDTGYSVTFPDLPGCFTEADSLNEAYIMASDAIGLYCETEGGAFSLPESSDPASISVSANEFVAVIRFDALEYLKRINGKSVKKTLTIPGWLDDIATKEGVNFSQLLRQALVAVLELEMFDKAVAEYKNNPTTYSLDDVERELGLKHQN